VGGLFKQETKSLNSMPMPLLLPDSAPGMGAFTIKNDEDYQVEFTGKKGAYYSTHIDKKRFSLSINRKRIEKGLIDTLLIKNSSQDGDFSFVFKSERLDDKFEIKIVFNALDLTDGVLTPIHKFYTFSHIQAKANTPISISLKAYGNQLIIDRSDNPISLNLKIEKQFGDEGKLIPFINQAIYVNGQQGYVYNFK
jgi:hypothetical protein